MSEGCVKVRVGGVNQGSHQGRGGLSTAVKLDKLGALVVTIIVVAAAFLSANVIAQETAPAGHCDKWRLQYHETFDRMIIEPQEWEEDRYGDDSPYHVDVFDDDGAYFHTQLGLKFTEALKQFRSFRKSFTYGEDGWLTFELYGRDVNRDGKPESTGSFSNHEGKARLLSLRHTDAAIIRSTKELPASYRVEVTVSNIEFGGRPNGSWYHNGMVNGYSGHEHAGPWSVDEESGTPMPAIMENGVYFLAIADYHRPAPHNNVFIHHHRKVAMDSDSNLDGWSQVWNKEQQRFERDGAQYVAMLWFDGEQITSPVTGNPLVSYTAAGWQQGTRFAERYLPGEAYTFTVTRHQNGYELAVSGKFFYGGQQTLKAFRKFEDAPVTWHYNQTPEQYQGGDRNQTFTYGTVDHHTWPAKSGYPDYFFFGDPHINYYRGSAEYDDIRLYLPDCS